MLNQFLPQYLGMAHPFTLPAAVGGVDIPGQDRWRRPTLEQVRADPFREYSEVARSAWPGIDTKLEAGAATVRIYDVTRGMSQRIEGQYRRHWGLVPGLWNLYFREQMNLGLSLKSTTRAGECTPAPAEEQDAAVAAAELYKKLQTGSYRDQSGRKRKLDGDTSKLMFAEGVTPLQKRLLADFRFRTSMVPGTQEIRTKIAHMGFWASVVYGNGIFMTVSPSERHNYIAVRSADTA